ncbi:hypothetical protein QQS21_004941 [Conoideocrella luteorostrata]|uniref:P-loop containing nucleoside triphosphate hydrolase protein n=1 Tax=Conoideocrella luteorostrata TaxID=1105319 RepID=A0AAJ0FZH2_9HYPO|nr:hypothetical protein QQS21_004941 [Conoideocrella luteorostrata]
MDGLQPEDPFFWDEDAVAVKLCALPRPCTANYADFAAKVVEHKIDGHTLLTYDLVGMGNGHDLRNELYQTLNVKLIRYKNALGEAIMMLRLKSRAFQQWKLDKLGIGENDGKEVREHGQDSTRMTQQAELVHLPRSSSPVNDAHSASLPAEPLVQTTKPVSQSQIPDNFSFHSEGARDCNNEFEPMGTGNSPAAPTAPTLVAANSPAKSMKRKRVMPQLLQETPLHTLPIPVATEADIISRPSQEKTKNGQPNIYHWDGEVGFSYLGAGSLAEKDVKSALPLLTGQLSEEGDTISTPVPTRFPPGRRLVVHKIMRRVLVKSNRDIAAAHCGTTLDESVGTSSEYDKILELDDLPEDLDEQTLKEIEAEKIDTSKHHAAKFVSVDRVQQILDEEVSAMTMDWNERKLPRYQRKAHSLWGASRCKTKFQRILEARKKVKQYDDRLIKLQTKILQETWGKERDIRLQARCLEQTLDDKLYQTWLGDMLDSRVPPSKQLPQPKRRIRRQKTREEFSNSEILTSSDEDNFIVDDDVDDKNNNNALDESRRPIHTTHSSPADEIKRAPLSTPRAGSPVYIDLTQIESSGASTPSKNATGTHSDRLTPTKMPLIDVAMTDKDGIDIKPRPSARSESLPLTWLEKYQNIEQVVSNPPSYWIKLRDRYGLVLALLWKLSHARRSAIVKHMQQQSVNESFQSTITRLISNPVQDLAQLSQVDADTLAFDLSRLFYCFLKVKNIKESRLVGPKPTLVDRLKDQQDKNNWSVYYEFLTQMAPRFPQDNQIFRHDMFDDELLDDNVTGEESPSLLEAANIKTPRKSSAKEIVQNKEAVDLREREKRRAEEQQARRHRLRANLGSASVMSHDKSRLIINETKQDDQPFIYINQEIGGRIKDHQIEGVRFMWNQIIQDPTLRQGCLLSHSMGLGKTMQVITLLVAIQESSKSLDPGLVSQIPEDLRQSKTLVACPAGLVNNWTDEIMIWDTERVLGDVAMIEAAHSREERSSISQKWSKDGGVLVVGYTMLSKVLDDVGSSNFYDEPNMVIADEAHILKNPVTLTHKLCSSFRTKSRIAMTGSPLANNIEEYYFMINWIAPNFLGPLQEFRQIYAIPIQHGVSTESDDSKKRGALKMLQVLKQTVEPKVHRATIKSCMETDLPPKQEFVLCVQPKALQTKLYDRYLDAMNREPGGQGSTFTLLSDLGLLCNHPSEFLAKAIDSKNIATSNRKRPLLPSSIISNVTEEFGSNLEDPSYSTKVELLIQILDHARSKGEKVLVFSQSIPTLNYLAGLFEKQKRYFSRLDGSTSIPKRQDYVRSFNLNKDDFYLISTKAGGVGLNIQGANRVVIFDISWNPMNEQQAVGRAYRIGQTKPVTVYYLVTAGTFEQDLHNRTVFKSQLASRVVDKKNPISWGNRSAKLHHHVFETEQEDLTSYTGKDWILDELISCNDGLNAIRKIIPTDTFEEEDDKALLSAEEQQEADDMIKLNQLRLSNPEEYRRLQDLKLQSIQHACYLTQGASPLLPSNRTTRDAVQTMDGASDAPIRPVLDTLSLHPAPLSATYPQWCTQPRSSQLMPIPGAQTFFASKSLQPTRLNGPMPMATPQAGPQNKPNPFNSVIRSPGKAAFRDKMCQKLGGIPATYMTRLDVPPVEFVDRITDSIDIILAKLKRGFLPDNKHWRTLSGFLEHERFVIGVITGAFTPGYLAVTDTSELEMNMAAFNNMTAEEFAVKIRNLHVI